MRIYFIILLFISISVLGNTGSDQSEASAANWATLLVGTWHRSTGEAESLVANFAQGGGLEFTVPVNNQTDAILGTWSVDGDTLTLTDDACGDQSRSGYYGYYKIVTIDQNHLGLSLINDYCDGRSIEIAHSWTRQ